MSHAAPPQGWPRGDGPQPCAHGSGVPHWRGRVWDGAATPRGDPSADPDPKRDPSPSPPPPHPVPIPSPNPIPSPGPISMPIPVPILTPIPIPIPIPVPIPVPIPFPIPIPAPCPRPRGVPAMLAAPGGNASALGRGSTGAQITAPGAPAPSRAPCPLWGRGRIPHPLPSPWLQPPPTPRFPRCTIWLRAPAPAGDAPRPRVTPGREQGGSFMGWGGG